LRPSLTPTIAEDVAHNKPRPELMDLGTITAKVYFSHAEGNYSIHGPDHTKINLHENIHEKHLKGQAISQQARSVQTHPVIDVH
jgi:hypothetical protein